MWFPDEPVTWQGCVCNEYDSLIRRHLVDVPKVSPEFLNFGRKLVDQIVQEIGYVEPMSWDQLINSRPARMKRRYRLARYETVVKRHAFVKQFIKFELMPPAGEGEVPKASRSIQYRSTPYTASLARFLLPIEKALHKGFESNGGFRWFAKGRNPQERADDLRKMFEVYDDPYIVLADHSKFDSCVQTEHLDLEFQLYKGVIKSRFMDWLLKQQYKNKGCTRSGIYYECVARRMSGDANTSLGNSIINYIVLRYMYGDKAIIYLDGDDSVVFLPEPPKPKGNTGFNTKTEIVRRFQDIEFCQSKPVMMPDGWVMCREPMRALRRMMWKCGRPLADMESYVKTIGIGEGCVSAYMPILADLASVFRRLGAKGDYKAAWLDYRLRSQKWISKCEGPTPESRESFCQAFGMDIDTQKAWKDVFDQLVLYKDQPPLCPMLG